MVVKKRNGISPRILAEMDLLIHLTRRLSTTGYGSQSVVGGRMLDKDSKPSSNMDDWFDVQWYWQL